MAMTVLGESAENRALLIAVAINCDFNGAFGALTTVRAKQQRRTTNP
jgi:hypothetical protein